VSLRVPILGRDDAVEGFRFEEPAYGREDRVAAGDPERSTGQKIGLDVDDQEGRRRARRHG
jgi:hypothetical protein